MSKRWFLSAPPYAIKNFKAIRTAAISAGVTLVDINYKLANESEYPGKPTEQIDPDYNASIHDGTTFAAPSWGEIEVMRKLLQQAYQKAIQLATETGAAEIPKMPTTEELWKEAEAAVKAAKNPPAEGGSVG